MNKPVVTAAAKAAESELTDVRLGNRFARLDLASKLALLAVERLGIRFDSKQRDRIGICLATRTGSLATDLDFWSGRNSPGGPSPTLFAYTLPSAPVGEIAIRHRLTGPNVCLVGATTGALAEAVDLIRSGEADGCLCIELAIVTPAVTALIAEGPAESRAWALYLERGRNGLHALQENDRDIESLCTLLCADC